MKDWLQETSDWLVTETLKGTSADRLLKVLCEKMLAGGIPIVRGNIACGQLHPLFKAFAVSWNRDTGLVRDRFTFEGAQTNGWAVSPLRAVLTEDRLDIRARLFLGEGVDEYPVLQEFKDQGYTDYYVTRQAFSSPASVALERMDGCIGSFATDDPNGFSDYCIAAIKRLFPRLAVALKTLVRETTAQNVASTYLGSQAGDRVLAGQIKRGDCESIRAAVWFSDMRRSTELADVMEPKEFLERLNRYFQCTAGSVLDHGGEVLRFIGDAVLAIFPINGPGGAERAGRMAISAARDTMARIAETNADMPDYDQVPIEFGLGLHVGDVLFGNIGVAERLEFSVIGPTANEVARLEDLTKTLGRTILASDSFVSHTTADWEPMGSHRLRGVTDPQQIYSLKI